MYSRVRRRAVHVFVAMVMEVIINENGNKISDYRNKAVLMRICLHISHC